jgi:hypothetical protein
MIVLTFARIKFTSLAYFEAMLAEEGIVDLDCDQL